jgi:hypothetical protein
LSISRIPVANEALIVHRIVIGSDKKGFIEELEMIFNETFDKGFKLNLPQNL